MITNDQRDNLLLDYHDRGILKKEIRSYEVSLWTLQDDFITVLKWSDAEQKGRIQNPKMTLNIDGTEKFTFSIPMYYRVYSNPDPNYKKSGELVENPNWYLVEDGEYLLQGLRKIKVIFNKGKPAEQVFEFVIVNTKEGHDEDIKTCEVETEGLAFQELGKIGYKIALSQERFELYYEKWAENGEWTNAKGITVQSEPLQTVDYWCDECNLTKLDYTLNEIKENPSLIDSRTWYYTVQMNWNSFKNDEGNQRQSYKVYEEPYATSWDNNLVPLHMENYREKARAVESEKSNLYNITQSIAEKFQIFCRYEYLHDENYHIVGRIIVFYNNFIQEENEFLGITYPYQASKIERIIESSDVTTKLYVLDVDNETTLEGYNSIMNSPANASGEDYILNFDYMLKTRGINQDQYDYIKEYEQKMAEFNKTLIELQNKRNAYEVELPKLKAELTIAQNSVALDKEEILRQNDLLNAVTDDDGYTPRDANNPNQMPVLTDANELKSIDLAGAEKGIIADTIKVFNTWYLNKENGAMLSNEIKDFQINIDENGNVESLTFLDNSELIVQHETNWSAVYDACGDNFNEPSGNVNLMDRVVVPGSEITNAGYADTPNEYETLYTQSVSGRVDKAGKSYTVYYTPILHSGEVLTTGQNASDKIAERYITSITNDKTTVDEWKSKDAKMMKLMLYVEDEAASSTPSGAKAGNRSGSTYASQAAAKQALWTKVRALNSNFGNYNNPYNVEVPVTTQEQDNIKNLISANSTNIPNEEQTSSIRVYVTYKFDPRLYFENIIQTWEDKLAQDNEKAQSLPEKVEALEQELNDILDDIADTLIEKEKEIHYFERLMGPALREGYWQPEDYNDYGDYMSNSTQITTNDITADAGNNCIIAWDDLLFDDEQSLEYQVGVTQKLEYFPCIKLSTLFDRGIPENLNEYTLVWKANDQAIPTNAEGEFDDIKNLQMMSVNSQALIRFLKTSDGVIPVLVLIGAKTLSIDQLERMIGSTDTRLEIYNVSVDDNGTVTKTHDEPTPIGNNWLCYKSANATSPTGLSQSTWNKFIPISDDVKIVYPRIKFSSLSLKTSSDQLLIKYGNQLLNLAEDYYINIRDTKREQLYFTEYYITIKPESLIKYVYNTEKQITVNYVLSNANTAIYLDAKKIAYENSQPKVSYEVDVNVIDKSLIYTLYNRLAQIVMINDYELKFEDVFGYISQVELELDEPQNDAVEIKNYKTKFEDLFSTIVAQTEDLKRAGTALSEAITGNMPMEEESLEVTLNENFNLLQSYLDSYFDSSEVVKERLTSLFNDAGQILADSSHALDSINSLTNENAAILAGMARNVREELTPQVFKQAEKPSVFKAGDIWYNTTDGCRYIAMSSSSDSKPGGTYGFVKTTDGSLTSITGASLNIDAEEGIIDLKAANNINIMSGNSLYIAADERVDIIGNREVNIGGTTINIGSTSESNSVGGVNIVATAYDTKNFEDAQAAKVLIHPEKITMAGSEIEMYTGSNNNLNISGHDVTSIRLNGATGIWLGSNKSINLFAGANGTGASVQINPTRIIMGVSSGNDDSVFELLPTQIVMGVGTTGSNFSSSNVNIDATVNNVPTLTGMKLTKSSFGLAVGVNNNRTAILADADGFIVGSGNTPMNNGSYVKISGSGGIELGSLADLYINTNNFKLQTNTGTNSIGDTVLAIGSNLQKINSNDLPNASMNAIRAADTAENTDVNVRLVLNKNGLYVKGTIYAEAGSFTGAVTATSFNLSGDAISDFDDAVSSNDTVQAALAGGELFTVFDEYGLIGYDKSKKNTTGYDANGFPTHHNQSYGLILGNKVTLPMLIGSNGGIHIINSSGNGSAVIIDKQGIKMQGSTIDLNAYSTIKIASNAIIDINSENFIIDSTAVGNESMFYVGGTINNVEKFIKYTPNGGLQIKGSITATSLLVGDTTGNNYLQYDSGTLSAALTQLKITHVDQNNQQTTAINIGNEVVDIAGKSGSISFSPHKWYVYQTESDIPLNDIKNNSQYSIGDLFEIRDTHELKGLVNKGDDDHSPTLETVEIKDSAGNPVTLYKSDNITLTDDARRIIAKYVGDSTIQIRQDGSITCASLVCFGDIICYGTVYYMGTGTIDSGSSGGGSGSQSTDVLVSATPAPLEFT